MSSSSWVRWASARAGWNPAARNARTLATFAGATCAHSGGASRQQVAGYRFQGATEPGPAAAGVHFDGQLPPAGDAAADRDEARICTPGRHVIAVAQGPGKPGWLASVPGVRAMGGGPGRAGATERMSIVCAWRPVCSQSACKNAGLSGPATSLSGSWLVTQPGSASMKITAWAVKPSTPASRCDGAGTFVTQPSAVGTGPRPPHPARRQASRARCGDACARPADGTARERLTWPPVRYWSARRAPPGWESAPRAAR